MRPKGISILLCALLLFKGLSALDTVKVMYYNLLNYPGSTPERVEYFRTINQYINADIILVNELINDEGAVTLLDEGLNVYGTGKFKKAMFTNGPDSDNMLFYDSTKVTLYSQDTIPTELRLINEYVLYSNDITIDTTFFYMYSAHLKSSTGSTNEQKRLAEVNEFINWVDNMPQAENIFFGGDLNFYDDLEPAYEALINSGVHPLNDPLTAGDWHDNASLANIHSQSTRIDQFGGGATGGMDDRFDFILYSDDVKYGLNGAIYIPNTCMSIGNDGNHFNSAIIDPPINTSVPDSVLQALYYMSDHLPVVCDIDLNVITQQNEYSDLNQKVDIYPNPTNKYCNIRYNGILGQVRMILTNNLGRVILQEEYNINSNPYQIELDFSGLIKGVHYINIYSEESVISRKIILF